MMTRNVHLLGYKLQCTLSYIPKLGVGDVEMWVPQCGVPDDNAQFGILRMGCVEIGLKGML